MKSLVVYYSLDGHTRLIADIIAGETGGDIYELKTVKPSTGKSGFGKFFLGGMRAAMNQKPALSNSPPDLINYEVIFIGTPVWGSRNAPAINTFISGSDLTGKKIMLFASSTGGDAGKCFDKLKSRLNGSEILGQLCFKDPTPESRDSHTAQVKTWLSNADM